MAVAFTNVMQQSPYEHAPAELVPLTRAPVAEWKPSRFNARTRADDGRLVLWNTLSGAISVFEAAQVPAIEALLKRNGVRAKEEGVVKYLHERGYLVAKDVDELRKLRLMIGERHYRSDILEIIAMASEDCNFRCVYCYEEFKRGTMLPEVREGIKNLVRKRLPTMQHLKLTWFGGEPLYGWEAVEDLAPFFAETARERNLSYLSHMTTNAYLLTPDRADRLLEWGCRDFQITIDGVAEEHDKRRVGRDGSPTFGTILDNLRSLRERDDHFFVSLRHNFDRDSLPRMPEFLSLLSQEFGGDPRFRLDLHAIGKWGGKNDDALNTCGVESREALVQLKRAAYEQGVGVKGGIAGMAGVGTQLCYAARPYNLLIGADGKVMKCTIMLDTDPRNIVGHINAQGDIDVDQDRMSLWTEPYYEHDKVCKSCHVVPMCQGSSCPMVRIQSDSKRRPCLHVKSNLHADMMSTLEQREERGRRLAVPARGTQPPRELAAAANTTTFLPPANFD